ncbi:MAG: hypothetical protein ACT4TC_13830 [Myxococcaceae bacterium]
MMRKTWMAALAAVVGLAALTGCNPECKVDADCSSGAVCRNEQCVRVTPDGTDAGRADGSSNTGDGGAVVPDGGANPTGDGGLGAYPTDLIGITLGSPAEPRAALVALDGGVLPLTTNASKWPRFSADGTAVVYVGTNATGGKELRYLSTASTSLQGRVLASAQGFDDFGGLEFSPGPGPVWAKVSGTSTSGLQWTPVDGTVADISALGLAPDWSPGGGVKVTFAAFNGIHTIERTGGSDLIHSTDGLGPKYNPTGTQLAYTSSALTQPDFDEELWTVDPSNNSKNKVAAWVAPNETTGKPGHFAALPAWSPSTNTLVYVEVRYMKPPSGPVLCQIAGTCGNEDPFQIMTVKIDPATGTAVAPPVKIVNGSMPALSPGDKYLAYITGGELRVLELDANTAAVGDPKILATGISTQAGDDSRPRWQPPPPAQP